MTCETIRELGVNPVGEQDESAEQRLARIMRRHSGAGYACCDWCLLVEEIRARDEQLAEARQLIDVYDA